MTSRRGFLLLSFTLASCGGGDENVKKDELPLTSNNTVNTNSNQTSAISNSEAWRPRFHYTPAKNWMNDPNGLVFFEGEYHLYYQYNPSGSDWGHISWGHAVSTDLLRWKELPVAIPETEHRMAFSGSVVIDYNNTSGFAQPGAPTPFIAFFTGFDPNTKIQSQHLAYSLDRGVTYTSYAGNPILDIGSTEFRDPKVFWHEPTKRWIMLVVAATRQEVWFYSSSNLKSWTKESTFGPAGSSANNIWEVPDLFELPVEGSTTDRRWVLIVSVNHGSLWGGSGVQYFVGNFDGTQFIADPNTLSPLSGLAGSDLIADFESGSWPSGWVAEGSAFGATPASGTFPGQQYVSGFLGRSYVSSYHGGDQSTGRLISPSFVISKNFISFLISGGSTDLTSLELVVNNQVVRRASGENNEVLKWKSWDVSALAGLQGHLQVRDDSTGPWGHINLDHIVLGDKPVSNPNIEDVALWADFGRDFYAPLSFANFPSGRVVWLGWVSNWDYARLLPTSPWRGQQSLGRELELRKTPKGLRLGQRIPTDLRPTVDSVPLASLRNESISAVRTKLSQAKGRQLMVRIAFQNFGITSAVGVELLKGTAGSIRVGYDPMKNSIFVDRTNTSPRYPGDSERHDAKRILSSPSIEIEVWLDGSIIEVFADDGTISITDLVYPNSTDLDLSVFSAQDDLLIDKIDIFSIKSVMSFPTS